MSRSLVRVDEMDRTGFRTLVLLWPTITGQTELTENRDDGT
jgi:hypothetical protein